MHRGPNHTDHLMGEPVYPSARIDNGSGGQLHAYDVNVAGTGTAGPEGHAAYVGGTSLVPLEATVQPPRPSQPEIPAVSQHISSPCLNPQLHVSPAGIQPTQQFTSQPASGQTTQLYDTVPSQVATMPAVDGVPQETVQAVMEALRRQMMQPPQSIPVGLQALQYAGAPTVHGQGMGSHQPYGGVHIPAYPPQPNLHTLTAAHSSISGKHAGDGTQSPFTQACDHGPDQLATFDTAPASQECAALTNQGSYGGFIGSSATGATASPAEVQNIIESGMGAQVRPSLAMQFQLTGSSTHMYVQSSPISLYVTLTDCWHSSWTRLG